MKYIVSLYTGAVVVLFCTYAMAESTEPVQTVIRSDLQATVKMFLGIAAGLGMALATFGGALGQGKAISAAVEGIARNPDAQPKIFIPMVVGLALIESLVLLSFVITYGLSSKI